MKSTSEPEPRKGWTAMSMNEAKYREAEARYWEVEGVRPSEEWLGLKQIGSSVRVQIVGDGPPVLFVHGGSINGTCFAPLAARLQGFRCLVLDRPGCGLSEPAPFKIRDPVAFASYADTLIVDVLDAMGLEAAIVATSLGGYHALRTAATSPQRITHVLELGFPIGAPNGPMPIVMRLAGIRSGGWAMARMPMSERAVRSMLSQIGLRRAMEEGRVPKEGVGWFRALLNHTHTMRNDLDTSPIFHSVRGVIRAILLEDEILQRIQVPTRFLWGTDDTFGGSDVAHEFVARIPGAELEVIPNGGHVVWLDEPDRIAAAAMAFLSAASIEHSPG